jgi:hypothetical protein
MTPAPQAEMEAQRLRSMLSECQKGRKALRQEIARLYTKDTSASSDVLELLNDLRHYANGEYKEADVSDDEDKMRIHLEYENRVWDIMKKLREKTGVRK